MPMRIIEAALVPVLLSGVAFAQRGTLEVLATDWRGGQIRSTQRVDLIKHQEHVEVDLTRQPSAP